MSTRASELVRRCWNRLIANWWRENARALRGIAFLPRYIRDEHDLRRHMAPSTPRLLLGERKWTSIRRWECPALHACVMDGMGEHYGYPRHYCYLLLWWNRRGYAWGVEYSTNTRDREPGGSAASNCSDNP